MALVIHLAPKIYVVKLVKATGNERRQVKDGSEKMCLEGD